MYHHAFEAMPFPRFIPEKWKRPCKIVYHLMLFITSTTKNLREEKWRHILRCPFIASMVVHYMQRPFLGWWHNKGHISREWMQRHLECDTQFKVKNELFVAFPRYFDNKCNKRKSFPPTISSTAHICKQEGSKLHLFTHFSLIHTMENLESAGACMGLIIARINVCMWPSKIRIYVNLEWK